MLKKLLILLLFFSASSAQAAVPYIFATQPAGNVPASYLDSDFAYVLTPPYTPPGTGALPTTVNSYLSLGYIHSLAYATGNGTTDDTAALQAWVNACLSTGLTCYLDPAPGGDYLISSALTDSSSNQLQITGPGMLLGAKITLGSSTQNGFYFTGTGRLYLSGFGIVSSGTPTAGAGIYIGGSANTTVGGVFDNLQLGFGGSGSGALYNGFYSTGESTFTFKNSAASAINYGAYFSTTGDSSIFNNTFNPVSSGSIGMYFTGDPGGVRITNNKINGSSYLAGIEVFVSVSDGDFFLSDNSIEGYTGYGIEFTQLSSMYDFGNVIINGNEIASSVAGARAIIFPATTSNWVTSVLITSNVLPNAQHGILVNAGEYLTIANNTCLDIDIGSAVTTGLVAGNTIQSGGSITNSSTSVIVPYNPGYNPVGASTISFSTSPNTYTAGASPETLYLSDSSGITALTDNGTSILPHTTGANVVLTVDLGPFETAVITSGGTLTGKKMIH